MKSLSQPARSGSKLSRTDSADAMPALGRVALCFSLTDMSSSPVSWRALFMVFVLAFCGWVVIPIRQYAARAARDAR